MLRRVPVGSVPPIPGDEEEDAVGFPEGRSEFEYMPLAYFYEHTLPIPEDAPLLVLPRVLFKGFLAYTNTHAQAFEDFVLYHPVVGADRPPRPARQRRTASKRDKEELLRQYPWLEREDLFPEGSARQRFREQGRDHYSAGGPRYGRGPAC